MNPDHPRQPDNYYAPDGFRYGVRFRDGSVLNTWNGRTQRQHAFQTADTMMRQALDHWPRHTASNEYLVVRHAPGQPWHVVCGYATEGAARCPESICDCFYDTDPDDPFGLHPEAYTVVQPDPPGGA